MVSTRLAYASLSLISFLATLQQDKVLGEVVQAAASAGTARAHASLAGNEDIALMPPSDVMTASFYPSQDLFVRRTTSKTYGQSSKITVTQAGSNQRIGLMKFETSSFRIGEQDGSKRTTATLQLSIADIDESANFVKVSIYRMMNQDLHEDQTTWDNFDGRTHEEHDQVNFRVDPSHKGKAGKIDVSRLLREGEDTVLGFAIEDEGHVKFHSKESGVKELMPKLVLTTEEDEL
eukprot:CAMPEP_0203687746 /NCGR_PEP_ID=MMETSP0091-20130426/700_1 /ASSEMBLY_ACC=CAM_ASM_001089 /TAXON_ID=426623 /ORGANISM="Chaetoceros affinis, Strain CCMP159" /LENGTH=233 /DNA_ID=CAMNT_0050557153 /DNA_START=37 /DNA_END=738 /DNA_ORIENTATION=+